MGDRVGQYYSLPDLRILVTGCRDWTDRAIIEREVAAQIVGNVRSVTVVTGDAPGVDSIAGKVATARGWMWERHFADWKAYGKSAGPKRNAEMVAAGADVCVAFWDGKSPGTLDCIKRAVIAGIRVHVVPRAAAEASDG